LEIIDVLTILQKKPFILDGTLWPPFRLTNSGSARSSARPAKALTWQVAALVIGTAVFNALLAFANTHLHINSAARDPLRSVNRHP